MCNPLPESRCASGGRKMLDSSIRKAFEASKHADTLADAVRIAKNADDIEFNAERYENVSKSIAVSLQDVNIRKAHIYAATSPTPELTRQLRSSTNEFGAYEQSFLKSEDDLMKTGKFLKKFQESATAARKANEARDEPVSQKELAQAVDTKTFPKLYSEIKKRVDANYAAKIKLAKSPEEKKSFQEEHRNHLGLLDMARDIAQSDAQKVYSPKKKDKDSEE